MLFNLFKLINRNWGLISLVSFITFLSIAGVYYYFGENIFVQSILIIVGLVYQISFRIRYYGNIKYGEYYE